VDNRTEQLADGVWRIEVGFYCNAYVLANDGHGDAEGLTVVDTGWRSAGPRLVRSVRMLGLDPRAIGDILLTHSHADHAGSAGRFAASSAGSRVWTGRDDLPVVRGERRQPSLVARAAARMLGGVESVPAAQPLDEAPPPTGLRPVPTPGHTPGHTSFLLPDKGVLLAGDAVANILALRASPRPVTEDRVAARASIGVLASLDFGTLAVGHGPPVRRRARERLEALAG
jgi:glyoxylase-like metal-dependent hydrolase (beta-lactamase superfamily II)